MINNNRESANPDKSRLAEYLALAAGRSELFVNPPQGGFTILLKEDEIHEVEAYMAQKLVARGMPATWANVGIVYQDQYGYILRDAVRFPGGAPGTYIRFVGKADTTLGLLLLPFFHGEVLLVRRFHHATRNWHLEILRGFGVSSLPDEENVRRELDRLLGATASRFTFLGKIAQGPGWAGSEARLFSIEVEKYAGVNMQEGITELVPVSIPDFERMIRDGEITDSFTMATYLYAKLQGVL